ncbi:Tetratricopeptide repeat-containing protein [Flexibacter flexilis DSM 6793]|uniref:Tetratricopeptide repeat-containing protein n=1 Tax=Flexibacter flexilis DSM 6793 TaxID=927664 RepID=A0A1I1LRY3_9BACT|nr:tetratricopeptide repeat protein [Flexibacter flexilis]SFC75726.1 Tetratricopeptide repeat-containing protein [Flexibacter flexilis DSM 6793]
MAEPKEVRKQDIPQPKEISHKEFVRHFQSCTEKKFGRFCFITGAGTSFTSKIPTGATLAKRWLTEIYDENWKKQKGITDDNAPTHYSAIYEKRFEIDPKEGAATLEELMADKEPSVGYSILAQILSKTPHRLVITTNFDSLIEDALFIYTDAKPLVLGHYALANYVNIFSKRPIIAKIHQDLLFDPKNNPEDTSQLDENWEHSLTKVLENYTPIVIGYGGNDGSLMDFLRNQKQPKGMFWLYREADGKPRQEILDLVASYSGSIVPINGFDEIMFALNETLGFPLLNNVIEEKAEKRANAYKKQVDELRKNADTETKEAIITAAKQQPEDWWSWQLQINEEKDPDKQNEMYLEGINLFPNSTGLINNYAVFLYITYQDYDNAKEYYLKALAQEPNNASFYSNYAIFLNTIHQDYDKAENLYNKALIQKPNDAGFLNNYALFLLDIRKDYDKADEYFLKGIIIDPDDANIFGNYAKNKIVQGLYPEAQELIYKAFELNNNEENSILLELWFYRYAIFWEQDLAQAAQAIQQLLDKGIRLPYFNLEVVCQRAQELKHPDMAQVLAFQQAINTPPPIK